MPLEMPQIRQLFMVLHGMYGNQLLDKYRIGEAYPEGEFAGHDKGLVSAQRVWLGSLAQFEPETVRLATERCKKLHKTFAPTLPEFEEICHALRPRYARSEAPALPMSEELKQTIRRQNREALAQAKLKRLGEANDFGSGVPALVAMVAKSVGAAGGDEVAVLMRLEQEFRKGSKAGEVGEVKE